MEADIAARRLQWRGRRDQGWGMMRQALPDKTRGGGRLTMTMKEQTTRERERTMDDMFLMFSQEDPSMR
jgi:hypothetical protein